ncbi:hypothetical protein [Solicola sp. PLA-1-18]|uniref:hypothetical protein n=1 Tax=Solicola sp. PLA-1-18 TaxID=3380532 RepID=UPI003B823606
MLIAFVAAGVVVGLAGAPASAQTKTRKDKAGDAPSRVDIRSVKVQNNAAKFAVTVRMANVVKRQTIATVGVSKNFESDAPVFIVESVPVAGGRYKTTALLLPSDPEAGRPSRVQCPGLQTTVKTGKRGYFRFVMPQSCLGAAAGRVETSAFSYDKQDFGGAVFSNIARRGDEPSSIEDLTDETSTITTRRG